ncbi:unnamed protein product [Leptosia nina]|uniref:Peptidase S1 domain-containing protein n=1 Tax=Leptosia nina TaxID=320188 RepID=A0AAV1J3Y5_9NEOP
MRLFTFVVALAACVAAVSSSEIPEWSTSWNYIQRIGIPKAKRIRAAEEQYLASRITGGSPANLGEFPYQAGLLSSITDSTDQGICGGVLLSSTRVLTAAHCWDDGFSRAWQFEVILGSVLIYSGGVRIFSEDVVMHAGWSISTIRNDIAMIRLPQAVQFSIALAACVAAVSSSEIPEWSTSWNYIQRIGIPKAKRIRAAEEQYLASRITGGSPANLGEFPYQAGLLSSITDSTDQGICGGVLLSSTRVLTAAHCWDDGFSRAWQFEVILGSVLIYSGGVRIFSEDVVMHAGWSISTIRNDIAMIRLPQAVQFSIALAACVAAVSSSEIPEWSTSWNYIQRIGIPKAKRIRAAEEQYLASRITGGSPANLGEFPYQAGLLSSITDSTDQGICGGVLLSSTRVLTAAHCWDDGFSRAWQFEVILGSVLIYSGGVRIFSEDVVMHAGWSISTIRNDIAMIRLPQAVQFSIALAACVAAVSSSEIPEWSTSWNYIQRIGIPKAKRIRAAEEQYLASRITGGSPANLGEFPYQAGLLSSITDSTDQGICGGVLLSSTRVLTAAHCWDDGFSRAWQFEVILGSVLIYSGGVRIFSEDVVMHAGWSISTIRNDIAMIRLPQAVQFSIALAACVAAVSSSEIPELSTSWNYIQRIGIPEAKRIRAAEEQYLASRITGGSPANLGEFPYQAGLLSSITGSNNQGICGGVLLSSTRVLTAAHC